MFVKTILPEQIYIKGYIDHLTEKSNCYERDSFLDKSISNDFDDLNNSTSH
jgi:hypothetical protein